MGGPQVPRRVYGKASIPLSPAVRIGKLIFISGQVPWDEEGNVVGRDVKEQTEQVLSNIRRLLEQAGATMADVVKTTVILKHLDRDFPAMNEVYARHFPDPKPARTTIGADLAGDFLVEIEAIAVVGNDDTKIDN